MTEREHKTKYSIYVHPCRQTNPICQQNLRGCRPTFDHHPTFFFFVFAFLHLFIGIVAICLTNDVQEYKVRYDDKCKLSDDHPTGKADIYFDNPALQGNLFFYFELHDFYQTYFLLTKEFSVQNIRGRFSDYPTECKNINESSTPTIPCEIIEQTFFTDNYVFMNSNFSDSDISWRYEKKKYHQSKNEEYIKTSLLSTYPNITQYFPGESLNEHFIVWMRISAHSDFRKLYAKSSNGCAPKLHVQVNCLYSYKLFHGKRYIVLLKPDGLGGKSLILSIFNFSFFAVNVCFIIIFETAKHIKEKRMKRRKLLDGFGEQETQYNLSDLPENQDDLEDQDDP